MIRLEHVRKEYADGFVALKDVNLEFIDGGLNVLIGPSGCGKSTTMKLINRLIVPSSGKVTIDGKDISRMNPVELRRSIGYVIQNVGLFPHMTIAQNVAVVPRLLRWDASRINKRVDELLELVHLDPQTYRNRYPAELSGGQQQRVGVIRALAADPRIVLMDEPFSALDPISREQLQDEIVELQQELKKTIVFVTHDMDEAIKIADNIVLMKAGGVVQQGTPEQILRKPANEFVKSFVGLKRLQPEHATAEELPNVEEVMATNPAVAYPFRGMAEAVNMMERRRVDSLLVVDRAGTLMGYVTIFQVLQKYQDENMTIGTLMKPFQHTVPVGASLAEAVRLITEHKLPYVPVVREGNKFAGLITKGSVVRYISELYGNAESEAETS